MKKMKKVLHKLRQNAGESIAEVLVSVLISALGVAMLAGAVVTSTHIVKLGKAATNDVVADESELVALTASTSSSVTFVAGGSYTFNVKYATKTIDGESVTSYEKG